MARVSWSTARPKTSSGRNVWSKSAAPRTGRELRQRSRKRSPPQHRLAMLPLLPHQVAIRIKLRPYVCHKCQLGFKDPTALKYHIQKDVCRNGKKGQRKKLNS